MILPLWAAQEFYLVRPPDISIISHILKRKDYWESAARVLLVVYIEHFVSLLQKRL